MDWPVIIRRETAALAAAVDRDAHPPVRSCPGWAVRDVAHHVGEVHRFGARVVRERLEELSRRAPPAAPPDDELAGWLKAGADDVIAAAEGVDPATPIWSWS